MKILRTILLILGLCFYFTSNAQIEVPSTQGKEFWVTFMPNSDTTTYVRKYLSLIISAKRACTGTISNPLTGWDTTFTVGNRDAIEIFIPQAQCYHTLSDIIDHKALYINSTDTISLFASNYQNGTFDMSNVLPVKTLRDEHIIQMYESNRMPYAEFIIIGTEDNTIVDIIPTAETSRGKPAGVPFNITINRGETYLLRAKESREEAKDFSGSYVKARDCKQIAIFAGNKSVYIPSHKAYSDHIFEQVMPTIYWGTKFAITRTAILDVDRVRVTALKDNTKIKKNGIIITTLAARETYEFEIRDSETSCFIETSAPVSVYLYIVGWSYGNIPEKLGDPAMVWISPIEQKIKEITFATAKKDSIKMHYVNVVVATTDTTNVRLNGNSIASDFSLLSGNPNLSFAQKKILPGTYTLQSSKGLIAHAYGLGNAVSYAFSVGSAAENLESTIWLNDKMYYSNSNINQYLCLIDSTKFYVSTNYPYKSVSWLLGDGSAKLVGDTIVHYYANGGIYNIEAVIERESASCAGDIFDTIRLTINAVDSKPSTMLYDTVCANSTYNKYGFNLLAVNDTLLTSIIPTLACDSAVNLHLTVNPVYSDTIKSTICLGDRYIDSNFDTIPNSAGLLSISRIYSTTKGCDSSFVLQLEVYPAYKDTINSSICLGESYTSYNFNITPDTIGVFSYDQNLKTIKDCDSITTLVLKVNNSYEESLFDTICEGKTYQFYDSVYSSSGIYTKVIQTVDACDSIMHLHLRVNPTFSDTIYADICGDKGYLFDGIVHTSSGIYVANYKTQQGCDSIVSLYLTVNPIYNEFISAKIYENEFYTVGKSNYNSPGFYTDSLLSIKGCDSIVNLDLSIISLFNEITAFSPFNKDGANDYFMPGFKLKVFNRWGALVYETITDNQRDLGWDGKNRQGKNVEPGVYFYILYKPDGTIHLKSSVEVLKR